MQIEVNLSPSYVLSSDSAVGVRHVNVKQAAILYEFTLEVDADVSFHDD
jgi:hypothetical protein